MDHLPERIQEKLIPEPNTGCWLYMGSWDSANGYGKISWGGRHSMLHRVVYELTVGPIPEGLILDHQCRVRACCNPAHLEPVTVQVNTERGEAVLFPKISAVGRNSYGANGGSSKTRAVCIPTDAE